MKKETLTHCRRTDRAATPDGRRRTAFSGHRSPQVSRRVACPSTSVATRKLQSGKEMQYVLYPVYIPCSLPFSPSLFHSVPLCVYVPRHKHAFFFSIKGIARGCELVVKVQLGEEDTLDIHKFPKPVSQSFGLLLYQSVS